MDTPTPTTNSETGSNKRHNRASSSTSSYNIIKGLSSLQTVTPSRQASIKNHLLASESFVKRLEQQPQLKGHRGCVNTIAWDETGEFLVSGSDDRKLNVYKPLDAQPLVHSIPSGHTQNIFSAKFLTGSSAQTIISCSADGITRLTSVPRFVATSRTGDWSPSPGFNCHTSMTYEVMPDLVDGHIFYDCADDGRFNRYDTRIRTSCDCDEDEACERHTFVNINSHLYRPPLRDMSMEDRLFHTFRRRRNEIGISAIAQQPENPVYFAAACSDDTVRIYDSRKVDPSNHRGAQVYSFSAYVPVQYVVGPNGELERGVNHDRSSLETRITSLKYDPCGTGQLLVSYSRGNCYLVDPSRLETKSDEAARISASDRRRSSSQSHESPKGKRRRSVSDEPAKKSSPDGVSSLKSETVTANEVATTGGHDDSGTADLTPPVSQDVKGKATLRSSSNHSKDKGESVSARKQKTRAKVERSARTGYFGSVMDVKGKGGDEDDDKDDDDNDDDDEVGEDEDEDEEMSFEDTDDEGDIISQKYKEARRTLPQEQLADDRDYWRQRAYLTAKSDLAQTYWGHANVKTMIKEANFYGPNSEFVMSGSDDGRIYVWNKKTGKLLNVVRGDKRVVNCLHPHPFSKFLLAASGIDNTIKIFMPTAEERVNMSKVRGIKRRIVEPFEVKPDSATGQEGWPKGPPEDELDPEYAFERVFHIPVGLGSSIDPSDDSEIHTSTDDDDGVDDDDDDDGSDIGVGDFLSHLPPHMVFQILRQVIHQEGHVHDDDDPSGDEDEEDDE
ncbi:DDB1- and CUL4-associated factor 6 [Linnemannia hyalina]|uniref:DDB1- and CUL4-associated factor 6 n=1 Tax=Linnemannia hyalina TaxID=64524 RepID=A0A9P7Y059_9FUNG|nr:DDB1- and CUL4-associated factor 6 [Linnemannia hyalina]